MAKQRGVVAGGHLKTVEAGTEILEEGGNAIEAMIASLMASTVAEPVFASPGGGGFAMVRTGGGDVRLFDFFSQTPGRGLSKSRPISELDFEAIQADFGPATQEFHIGAGSTAVPGFVEGLFALHDRYSRLPFERLAAPAIRLAREGVKILPFQAYLFSVVAPILTHTEAAKELFAPRGELMQAGEVFRNPGLADFYEVVAREGVEFVRSGDGAAAFIKQSDELGGLLSHDDLANYRVIERTPLRLNLCGADVYLNPQPAASGVLIGFGLRIMDRLIAGGTVQMDALLQALKATVDVRCTGVFDRVGADLDEIVQTSIEKICASPTGYRGTTHISIIDGAQNAASVTVSNGEGNGHIVNSFGFMLNNMLGEEDLNEKGFFEWEPNIRLSSMMAPTIIETSCSDIIALGSGGSNRIRSAVLQVSDHILRHGLTLSDAINAPRLHIEKGGQVSFEDIFSSGDRDKIVAFQCDAHAWPERNMFFGGVHGAAHTATGLDGAGDVRRDGVHLIV